MRRDRGGLTAPVVTMMGGALQPAAAASGQFKLGVLTCQAGFEVGLLSTRLVRSPASTPVQRRKRRPHSVSARTSWSGQQAFILQQRLSVQGQAGLNLAVGVSILHLEPGT